MRSFEVTFNSVNSDAYAKPITAVVVHPDEVTGSTGVLVVSHGWGGNRFQYAETMDWAAEHLNLVCVSVEFRGSGYEFDRVTGRGAVRPYDASFYQLFDVLGGLRFVLDRFADIDRGRIYHYGGSQGGHLALLSAIYAPATFACVYATSPAALIEGRLLAGAGRSFDAHEASARNVLDHVEAIRCPVILEHGTSDPLLPCDVHTRELERLLRRAEVEVSAQYYEGGDHFLAPVTTRIEEFKAKATTALTRTRLPPGDDDFAAGSTVTLRCADRTLIVDWSEAQESESLFRWDETILGGTRV